MSSQLSTDASWSFPFCPQPPAWKLDWKGTVEQFSWVRAMAGCAQDPEWHAEGDVLIHTRLVCEALCGLSQWRSLGEVHRSVVFAAALMHDVAKPMVSRNEDGRIRAPRHAPKGAQFARRVLMQELLPSTSRERLWLREQIVNLIRYHGLPLCLLNRGDPQRELLAASQVARCDWLAIVALADVLGRQCADKDDLLDRVEMFRELALENECLNKPRQFASDHTRFLYFRGRDLDPAVELYDDTIGEVIVMSGLPGSGKDHWIQQHGSGLPQVSLDAIRDELGVSPASNQGAIVNRAKEQARQYLRSGTDFIWNATNTTVQMRRQLIQLFSDYHARVRVVYVEPNWNEIKRRNMSRDNPVPQAVLDKLVDKLDIPDLTESHALQLACDSAG